MGERYYYSWGLFNLDIRRILRHLKNSNIKGIYAIPRGGLIVGTTLSNHLNVPLYIKFEDIQRSGLGENKKELLIVDDIVDSGNTMLDIVDIEEYTTAVLFIKDCAKFQPNIYCNEIEKKVWVNFCWEPKESLAKRSGTMKND